jgi:hypothetical protein
MAISVEAIEVVDDLGRPRMKHVWTPGADVSRLCSAISNELLMTRQLQS